MSEEVSIRVSIADRVYPLKVSVAQEPVIRQAAKLINEKIKSYKESFDVNEKPVLLSMCALQFVTELLELKNQKAQEEQELHSEIKEMKTLLDDYLK